MEKKAYPKAKYYTDTHLYHDLMNLSRVVLETSKNVQVELRETAIKTLLNDSLECATYIRYAYETSYEYKEEKRKYIINIVKKFKKIEVDFCFARDLKAFSIKTAASISILLGSMENQLRNWLNKIK